MPRCCHPSAPQGGWVGEVYSHGPPGLGRGLELGPGLGPVPGLGLGLGPGLGPGPGLGLGLGPGLGFHKGPDGPQKPISITPLDDRIGVSRGTRGDHEHAPYTQNLAQSEPKTLRNPKQKN